MFQLFKKKNTKTLSELLAETLAFLKSNDIDDTWAHLSQREMIDLIENSISKIESGSLDKNTSDKLWGLFAPTCDWDDIQGNSELGENIFSIISEKYGMPEKKNDKNT